MQKRGGHIRCFCRLYGASSNRRKTFLTCVLFIDTLRSRVCTMLDGWSSTSSFISIRRTILSFRPRPGQLRNYGKEMSCSCPHVICPSLTPTSVASVAKRFLIGLGRLFCLILHITLRG